MIKREIDQENIKILNVFSLLAHIYKKNKYLTEVKKKYANLKKKYANLVLLETLLTQ